MGFVILATDPRRVALYPAFLQMVTSSSIMAAVKRTPLSSSSTLESTIASASALAELSLSAMSSHFFSMVRRCFSETERCEGGFMVDDALPLASRRQGRGQRQ